MRSELDEVPGLEPLIVDVVRRLKPDLDSFVEDIRNGDVGRARETAHKSKGMLALYGFPALADLYSRCEDLCAKERLAFESQAKDQLIRITSDIRAIVADVSASYELH